MDVTVIGTGYVGLVTGACLAELGNHVVCADVDAAKVGLLQCGVLPIYEPGLDELVARNAAAGRLRFTADAPAAVARADVVFVAVGTPSSEDGSADLSHVLDAARVVARHLAREAVVVVKSTVPVGTTQRVAALLAEHAAVPAHACSNPEFLKQGNAVEDFMRPDRVVVGVAEGAAGDVARRVMTDLYAPLMRTSDRLLVMDRASAEMTKYAANAMLAARVTLINEIAHLCEHVGANAEHVRRGVGADRRIGTAFLFPGPGYGGSCFPKDVRALARVGRREGAPMTLLEAIDPANRRQRARLGEKVRAALGGAVHGTRVAVWGLAFKARTDDVRESAALELVEWLLDRGAAVAVHDPAAMAQARRRLGARVTYAPNGYAALPGADALVVATEWHEYRRPDFARVAQLLRQRVVVDARNLYDPASLTRLGLTWHGVGRAPAGPLAASPA